MTSAEKIEIGKCTSDLLKPFRSLHGGTLHGVRASVFADEIDGLYLAVGDTCLHISVNNDDDTIEIKLSAGAPGGLISLSDVEPWKKYIGKDFGWGWIGVNQQGYLDTISLSFGQVVPQVSLTAVASGLFISQHIPHNKLKQHARIAA